MDDDLDPLLRIPSPHGYDGDVSGGARFFDRGAAVLLLVASSCAADSDSMRTDDPAQNAAYDAAEAWRAAHPDGFQADFVGNDAAVLGTAPWNTSFCGRPQANGYHSFVYSSGDIYFDLGFLPDPPCLLRDEPTLENLRQTLDFFEMEGFPLEIEVDNWCMSLGLSTPYPRKSSVEFLSLEEGRLRFVATIEGFSVGAHDNRPECVPPADGGYEPECYVSLEHHIPVVLSFDVPFTNNTAVRDGLACRLANGALY